MSRGHTANQSRPTITHVPRGGCIQELLTPIYVIRKIHSMGAKVLRGRILGAPWNKAQIAHEARLATAVPQMTICIPAAAESLKPNNCCAQATNCWSVGHAANTEPVSRVLPDLTH